MAGVRTANIARSATWLPGGLIGTAAAVAIRCRGAVTALVRPSPEVAEAAAAAPAPWDRRTGEAPGI